MKWQRNQLRDDINAVKNLIETFGWIPNNPGSPEEGFCLLGAISYHLVVGELDANEDRGTRIEQQLQRLTVAPVQYWNDTIGRTPSEVATLTSGTRSLAPHWLLLVPYEKLQLSLKRVPTRK